MNVSVEPVVEYRKGDFLVSTDRSRLDVQAIYEFLTHCEGNCGGDGCQVDREFAVLWPL